FRLGEFEVRRVRGAPWSAIAESIALEPIAFRGFSPGVGVSGSVTVIAAANFHDVSSTLNLLSAGRGLFARLSAKRLTAQRYRQANSNKRCLVGFQNCLLIFQNVPFTLTVSRQDRKAL